MTFKGQFFTTM